MTEIKDPKDLYLLMEKVKSVAKEGAEEWVKLQDVLLDTVVNMVVLQCRENIKIHEMKKMTYGQMYISATSVLQNIRGVVGSPSFVAALIDKAVKALGDEVGKDEREV